MLFKIYLGFKTEAFVQDEDLVLLRPWQYCILFVFLRLSANVGTINFVQERERKRDSALSQLKHHC